MVTWTDAVASVSRRQRKTVGYVCTYIQSSRLRPHWHFFSAHGSELQLSEDSGWKMESSSATDFNPPKLP